MTKDAVLQELADADGVSLEAFEFLEPILLGIVELTPEQEEQYRDWVAAFTAGLEGMRNELGMPWDSVNRKRIDALAKQMLDFAADWSVHDSFLVGTFLAASSRRQLVEASGMQPEQANPLERTQAIAATAIAGNQSLQTELEQLKVQLAEADEAAKLAKQVVLGSVSPATVISSLTRYAKTRGL